MKELNKAIEHTLLKPAASEEDIRRLCREAMEHGFYGVCVNSCHVPLCREELAGSDVAIVTVVGFPLGAAATAAKAAEAAWAAREGAREIDMVLNVGALKEGRADFARADVAAVVESARAGGAIVKVILETCLLTEQEIVTASLLAKEAGAAFVKTSTGFSTGGATAAHVRLMRETVGEDMGVKAAGGIRSCEDALAMLAAGADRLGTSASLKIVGAEA